MHTNNINLLNLITLLIDMKSTLKNEDTLNDLQKAYDTRSQVLEEDALHFGRQKVTEEEVIRDVLKDIKTLRIGEREITLPGVEANERMIIGAVAKFKREVYSGNVKPAKMAGHDDIVVELAREKTFEGMQAGNVNNFAGTVATEGASLNIVPAKGISGTATLDDNQWLFFTGDFIDLNSDAVITAIQYVDVDGETNYNPEGHIIFSERDSDIQVNKVSAELVKSTVNIDGYGAFAGNAEVVPVAIHIAQGKHVASLT